MMITYNANKLYNFLTKIGAKGRHAFQMMHATTDFSFPLVYGLFFHLIIHQFSYQFSQQKSYLPFLAFLPTGFDLTENFTLIYITDRFPDDTQKIATVVPLFTFGKFICLAAIIILIVFLAIRVNKQTSRVK